MDIEQLSKQLELHNRHSPVERWNPPFCGDMDIQIQADGSWLYMGTPIQRLPLVKLFARVLTIEKQQYYLVTPIEKVRIKVADAPFVVIRWRQETSEQGPVIIFTTNVEDEFVLSPTYPLALPKQTQTGPLYLNIHRGLQARLHRNVYYQLAEIAQSAPSQDPASTDPQWQINSGGMDFCLG